jgi:hypothetical protein
MVGVSAMGFKHASTAKYCIIQVDRSLMDVKIVSTLTKLQTT